MQELDLADFHHHVHLQTRAGALEHIGGFELRGREGRDKPCVGEAGWGAEEVWVESERGV